MDADRVKLGKWYKMRRCSAVTLFFALTLSGSHTLAVEDRCNVPEFRVILQTKKGSSPRVVLFSEIQRIENEEHYQIMPIGDYLGHFSVIYNQGENVQHATRLRDSRHGYFRLPCGSTPCEKNAFQSEFTEDIYLGLILWPCRVSDHRLAKRLETAGIEALDDCNGLKEPMFDLEKIIAGFETTTAEFHSQGPCKIIHDDFGRQGIIHQRLIPSD